VVTWLSLIESLNWLSPLFTMKLKNLLALPAALVLAMPAFAGSIVIKGSDTLGAKFVPQLAEAFKGEAS
jgi:hypothetical protein